MAVIHSDTTFHRRKADAHLPRYVGFKYDKAYLAQLRTHLNRRFPYVLFPDHAPRIVCGFV